ncbi:MAG TPA: tyrosine-type recombinase/integrase [Streptosporangiaceae bacterium]|nr:tyrosine-type recombinase/integrase [Streptosporangiaceae bacterium]
MSTAPVKVGRGVRCDLDAGPLAAMVESFELHLHAERKSPKTIRTYIEAALWFAGSYLLGAGITDWAQVTRKDVQHWIAGLAARYGKSGAYASNQFRALQQFFKWYATEDPADPRPNPMAGLKPPKVDETEVPVFTAAELTALLATCKGGGFENRRDHAILSLFRDTGIRLAELAGLCLDDVSLRDREALVTGKGSRQRRVRFTYDTARAVDRYLRERARHKLAARPRMWLGTKNRDPMTPSGIYQMVCRRGAQARVEVHPHKFRHHFSHTWLDQEGAEGDLMELNGWSSPQMLRRYGRSAASARARRSYDRIMDAS